MKRLALLIPMVLFGFAPVAQASLVSLPGATFGGSGIPNDAVAVWSGDGITLGLTAHTRCQGTSPQMCGPAVTNDGIDTFFAESGTPFTSFGSPYDTYAGWNFGFYADTRVYDIAVELLYQGTGLTPWSSGYIPLSAGSTEQNSWNLDMAFLGATGFDASLAGTYRFELRAWSFGAPNGFTSFVNGPNGGLLLGSTYINVNVPEPATSSLFALGFAGAAVLRRRKR